MQYVCGPAFSVEVCVCCSDTVEWSVAALRYVQAAGDVGGGHSLSALCAVYVVCLAVSWLSCVWSVTSPHHSLASNLTKWKHPTFAATFIYCRLTGCITHCVRVSATSGNVEEFNSCRRNVRRLNKKSSKCQWRNIVRENCLFLTSHLELHQCLMATYFLFYYTVIYDVGNK